MSWYLEYLPTRGFIKPENSAFWNTACASFWSSMPRTRVTNDSTDSSSRVKLSFRNVSGIVHTSLGSKFFTSSSSQMTEKVSEGMLS